MSQSRTLIIFMYIIRETFIAKPGYAGKFAMMMKKEMENWKEFKGYVLLDIATDYNTIVIEYEVENLGEFGKMMEEHKKEQNKQKTNEKPPEYTELYLTGKREIFRMVE